MGLMHLPALERNPNGRMDFKNQVKKKKNPPKKASAAAVSKLDPVPEEDEDVQMED